jgi:hypothetical protein
VPPDAARVGRVAEKVEQRHQLIGAAVHVADDVERSVLAAAVRRQRPAHDRRRRDLLGGAQHVHVRVALVRHRLQAPVQLLALPHHHLGSGVAIGPLRPPCLAHRLR